MKLLIITAIFCMLQMSVAISDAGPVQGDAKFQSGSTGKVKQENSALKVARSTSRFSVISDEKTLCKALGLPAANDFQTFDDTLDGFEEFENQVLAYQIPESDIPLTINSRVEYFINYFQTSGRPWFAKLLTRSERYLPMMKEILRKNSLPEDLVYLAMIESGFSPHAYSHAKAVGPWQFMAGTGKLFSLRIDPWIDERRDPLKSTVAAAMYLKKLYGIFNNDWYLAAAGYNAGENKILRAIDMYESSDFWELAEGSYLKRETKDYVPKLLAAAIIAKDPAKYGFADVAYLPPIEFDTVPIPTRTDLELVAKLIEVSYETLRGLNPELRRWCTPPDYPDYELKLPKGKKNIFLESYAKIPETERYTEKYVYARYRARKGDTVASIARHFGADPDELASINNLKISRRLRGKILTVPLKPDCHDAGPVKTPSFRRHDGNSEQNVKYYTIKRGDTLTSVARRFNVAIKVIAVWNNLKLHAVLMPGKKIIVAKSGESSSS
ncbi:MAG TPA: transglycosylase SLT domain-containing protein [Geobacteraceae bacterium]|nr:transglycosylase SLT domain-containing protein [Geobacteraceae bacterium]